MCPFIASSSVTAALITITAVSISEPLYAQTDAMYFGAYTPAGKPIAKPYPRCVQETMGKKILWVCPRLQTIVGGVDHGNGQDRSDATGGNTSSSTGMANNSSPNDSMDGPSDSNDTDGMSSGGASE
ncbi:hypothetical protein D3C80_1166610 [compost metagenome]